MRDAKEKGLKLLSLQVNLDIKLKDLLNSEASVVQFIQTTGSIIIVMEYGCQIQSWPLQPSCPHTSLPSEYGPLALAMTITSLLSLCRRELRR